MLYIGCHLSSSKGFLNMGKEARSIGANTFQFFTRNPRGGSAKPFDAQDAAAYCAFAEKEGYYAKGVSSALGCDVVGIDLAKEAVQVASSGGNAVLWAVASSSRPSGAWAVPWRWKPLP